MLIIMMIVIQFLLGLTVQHLGRQSSSYSPPRDVSKLWLFMVACDNDYNATLRGNVKTKERDFVIPLLLHLWALLSSRIYDTGKCVV